MIRKKKTEIYIPESLLKETMRVSGKEKYSEAIVTSLKDYLELKKRLSFLDELFSADLPHSFKKIKKKRRERRWSS